MGAVRLPSYRLLELPVGWWPPAQPPGPATLFEHVDFTEQAIFEHVGVAEETGFE
jgi:hypothetical protein